MPYVGEVKRAKEIGKPDRRQSNKYVWTECPNCKKARWIRFDDYKLRQAGVPWLCPSCEMKWRWQKKIYYRGMRKSKNSKYQYIAVWIPEDDFFASMRMKNGRVAEHRLVMAKHLGRSLHRWEIVHHKNGIKDDNRIENLQLVTDDRHKQITILETKIQQLEAEIVSLKAKLNRNNPRVG